MLIAECIVDPTHRRPVLVIAQGCDRIGCLCATIDVVPFIGANHVDRVGCMFQRIVIFIHAAFLNFPNFVTNRNHRFTKTIDFFFGFRLGRFDHQCAWNRKVHGRRVKAVIDKPLGNIVDGDAGAVLDHTRIDDAFVRDQAVGSGIQDWKMFVQSMGNVVGV